MCYAKLLGHKWWWWQVEWRVFELKCFFNQTKNICFKGPYKHIRAHIHAYVCGVYYTMCTKYIYAQTIGCEVTRIAIMVNCWVRILLARFAVSVVHFCFLCVCRILTAKPGYSNRLSDSETKKKYVIVWNFCCYFVIAIVIVIVLCHCRFIHICIMYWKEYIASRILFFHRLLLYHHYLE